MKKIVISRTNLGKKEEKEIFELEEIDLSKYRLLGQSIGISIGHCVQMGLKNKENFWDRVYGYKIIKNEKMDKIFLEAMSKVKSEVKEYITVKFYERLADQKFMYIPKRLKIKERPELKNFPLNIMFSTVFLTDEGKQTLESSLYNPDLSTYKQEENVQKMKYFNSLDKNSKFWIEIVYNTVKESWKGTKYYGEKTLGMAMGSEWKMFFMHLTALGVSGGVD